MLYIVRKDKGGKKDERTWHIGNKKPIDVIDMECLGQKYQETADFSDVIEIQADGHELEHIQANFSGIPMSTKRVVNWKGEIAQFIYDHL